MECRQREPSNCDLLFQGQVLQKPDIPHAVDWICLHCREPAEALKRTPGGTQVGMLHATGVEATDRYRISLRGLSPAPGRETTLEIAGESRRGLRCAADAETSAGHPTSGGGSRQQLPFQRTCWTDSYFYIQRSALSALKCP